MTKECWLCHQPFSSKDIIMCKCCAFSEMKDRHGNLACKKCCRIIEKVKIESYRKKYGECYWEHKDWGKL